MFHRLNLTLKENWNVLCSVNIFFFLIVCAKTGLVLEGKEIKRCSDELRQTSAEEKLAVLGRKKRENLDLDYICEVSWFKFVQVGNLFSENGRKRRKNGA